MFPVSLNFLMNFAGSGKIKKFQKISQNKNANISKFDPIEQNGSFMNQSTFLKTFECLKTK